MLIRSQNKEHLYNLNTISGLTYQKTHDYKRGKENNINHNICIDYGGLNESIGLYSTKEKAIKVLDIIERFYAATELHKIGTDVSAVAVEFENMIFGVFQMPQDSEVQP